MPGKWSKESRLRVWESHVRKRSNGCWQWMGSVTDNGYGRFGNGIYQKAHRAGYILLVGEIAEGMQLDHLCRNRLCVNPSRLEPVTPAENIRRGETGQVRGQQMKDRTHCPSGHSYELFGGSFRNGRRGGRMTRYCKECQRIRHLKKKATAS